MNEVDHVNVKVYATPDSRVNWADLIPVFHRWIRENTLPGTLIDVTDYAHVPDGPGILLIAHEAFYSVDNRRNRLGFLYNRRTTSEGSPAEKIQDAWSRAVASAKLLERDPGVTGLRFDEKQFEISINDRMLAPNTAETAAELGSLVEALYQEHFGQTPTVVRESEDPRSLLRLRVTPGA